MTLEDAWNELHPNDTSTGWWVDPFVPHLEVGWTLFAYDPTERSSRMVTSWRPSA